jgi:hypothetical protein
MNVVLLAVAFYGGFFLLFTLPVIIFIVRNARKNGRLNDIQKKYIETRRGLLTRHYPDFGCRFPEDDTSELYKKNIMGPRFPVELTKSVYGENVQIFFDVSRYESFVDSELKITVNPLGTTVFSGSFEALYGSETLYRVAGGIKKLASEVTSNVVSLERGCLTYKGVSSADREAFERSGGIGYVEDIMRLWNNVSGTVKVTFDGNSIVTYILTPLMTNFLSENTDILVTRSNDIIKSADIMCRLADIHYQ